MLLYYIFPHSALKIITAKDLTEIDYLSQCGFKGLANCFVLFCFLLKDISNINWLASAEYTENVTGFICNHIF